MNRTLYNDPLVLGLLAAVVVLLIIGFVVYRLMQKTAPERRALKDLRVVADLDPRFDWETIQKRVVDCYYRMHASWEGEDDSGVPGWMTAWYWQNRQQPLLGKLRKEGVVRVCDVKRISKLKPLLFVHNNTPRKHLGSVIVIGVTAHVQDYLADSETGRRKYGRREYKDIEGIWSYTLDSDGWKLSDIEHASMAQTYIAAMNDLPKIEDTLENE